MDVHQVVRDPDGEIVADGRVQHVYTLRDGLVVRMDVRERSERNLTRRPGLMPA